MSNRTAHHETRNTTPGEPLPKPRILIVDDDDMIRGLYEAVLSHAGYGTEGVSNGQEALVMLATADFDLLLTDRNMPVLDGVGLIRGLRAAGSRIPVIMISGSLANGRKLPADIREEVAMALPKPASMRELLTGIASSLRWRPTDHWMPCAQKVLPMQDCEGRGSRHTASPLLSKLAGAGGPIPPPRGSPSPICHAFLLPSAEFSRSRISDAE